MCIRDRDILILLSSPTPEWIIVQNLDLDWIQWSRMRNLLSSKGIIEMYGEGWIRTERGEKLLKLIQETIEILEN